MLYRKAIAATAALFAQHFDGAVTALRLSSLTPTTPAEPEMTSSEKKLNAILAMPPGKEKTKEREKWMLEVVERTCDESAKVREESAKYRESSERERQIRENKEETSASEKPKAQNPGKASTTPGAPPQPPGARGMKPVDASKIPVLTQNMRARVLSQGTFERMAANEYTPPTVCATEESARGQHVKSWDIVCDELRAYVTETASKMKPENDHDSEFLAFHDKCEVVDNNMRKMSEALGDARSPDWWLADEAFFAYGVFHRPLSTTGSDEEAGWEAELLTDPEAAEQPRNHGGYPPEADTQNPSGNDGEREHKESANTWKAWLWRKTGNAVDGLKEGLAHVGRQEMDADYFMLEGAIENSVVTKGGKSSRDSQKPRQPYVGSDSTEAAHM